MNYAFDQRLYTFNSTESIQKEYDVKLTNLPEQKYNYKPLPPYKTQDDTNREDPYPYKGILGNIQDTPFSLLFFSRQNIEEIQTRLRNDVYTKSDKKYKISNQDERNLVNVMVNIYTTYGKNEVDPKYFKESITHLNDLTVKKVVPNIISQVKSHMKYLEDKMNPYGGAKNILPPPEATSIAGTKMYL